MVRCAYQTFEEFSLGGMTIAAAGTFNGLIFLFLKRILELLQSSSMEYAVIKVVGNHGGSECGLLRHAHWRL